MSESFTALRLKAKTLPILAAIVLAVVLLLMVLRYGLLANDEKTLPLTQADIDRAISRVVTERLEPLEATLSQATTNVAQLHARANDQQAALRAEIATLSGQLSQYTANEDWQRGLKQARQHWQSTQTALTRRVQRLETQAAQVKEKASASKTAAAQSTPDAPPFQVASVDRWGDIVYVTVTSKAGKTQSLRQGQAYAGWRFNGVTPDHAVFVNGTHTNKLPVGR